MPKASDPRTGRRITLNRDRVLDTAVVLADAEGIDAMSMRRLARELGVEAMSLYNHISNKDDLLDGMLDRVCAEMELPDGGPNWRDTTRNRAISAHAVLMRHPWAAAMWTARHTPGPARLRYMDSALRSLREAGFTTTLLDRTYHAIENHIVGHSMQALGFPLDNDEMQVQVKLFMRTFPVEDYPDLAAHIQHHIANPGGDDEFEFGLDLILDGLDRMRGSATVSSPGHATPGPIRS